MRSAARLILLGVCLLNGSLVIGQPVAKTTVKLLVFGDVNLGRMVGQRLVRGDLSYPFVHVGSMMSNADAVFVNLESQLSDQKGETQHPRFNLIFCGPPSGAEALRQAHVSVVSTANNHAFDYGMKALVETLGALDSAGIAHAGTSADSLTASNPAILELNGIRIGILSYTQFVNLGGGWKDRISLFRDDEVRGDVERLRPQVDILIVSYHGGEEYRDRPPEAVRRNFRLMADAGADIIVGHHPHYVQGIEWYHGKLLLYSLGNFVFYQPQLEWTRYGLAVEVTLKREERSVQAERVRLLPVSAGLQPSFNLSAGEERSFFQRLMELSTARLYEENGEWFVRVEQDHE